MSRGRRWIAGLVLVFAASFAAGAAVPDNGEQPRAEGARPLATHSDSARIDPLSTPPRLPALRHPARTAAPPPAAPRVRPPPPSQPDAGPGTAPPPPPPPPPGAVLPPEAPPQ